MIGAAGAVAAAGGFAGYAVRGRSASFFAPSEYHGDRSKPALALTFDDGPSESTPALLEVLARLGVSATFFMCGRNVRRDYRTWQAPGSGGRPRGRKSYRYTSAPRFQIARVHLPRDGAGPGDHPSPHWDNAPVLSRAVRSPLVRDAPRPGAPPPDRGDVDRHRPGLDADRGPHFRPSHPRSVERRHPVPARWTED